VVKHADKETLARQALEAEEKRLAGAQPAYLASMAPLLLLLLFAYFAAGRYT
jgi:hypothetical protein